MKNLSFTKITHFIIIVFFVLLGFILSINTVEAQTADGACSAGATVLEKSCTFQKGISRISGKCQVKDKNRPELGLTCRSSLGSSCSGDTCENGLVCISEVCSRPRGNKTEGQSCSGNDCIAGLECRDFICKKEGAITGNPGTPSTLGTPSTPSTPGTSGSPGGSTGSETGLVKCGVSRDCTICDIFILIRDIFNFALGLLTALAVVSIVIGGVYIVTSAGDSGRAREGYSIITNAVIGLLLVMASFLFFSFALVSLGFQSANFSAAIEFRPGEIFNVKCDNASTFNDNGQNGGGQGTLSGEGGGSGNVGTQNIACLDSKNIDDDTSAVLRTISRYESGGAQNGYYKLTGGKLYPSTTIIHPGVTDVNLFKTTPTKESDAYGRYQMISTTWNGWASQAGVPLAQQGTNSKGERYYNMSPVYQDAAVARTLKQNNVSTCSSFFASARSGGYASQQWAAFKSGTTGLSQGESLCNSLLADERTGNCK